jgi:hypothetical protein
MSPCEWYQIPNCLNGHGKREDSISRSLRVEGKAGMDSVSKTQHNETSSKIGGALLVLLGSCVSRRRDGRERPA